MFSPIPIALRIASWMLLLGFGLAQGSEAAGRTDRVREGLLVEYRFDSGEGDIVRDRSGLKPALDLAIEAAGAVRWVGGGLAIEAPTLLTTKVPALRVTERIRQTGAFSVEAWIRPANLTQQGPARLIGISNGSDLRNFTLGQGLWGGQPSDTFNMRARTTETDLDGMPLMTTGPGSAHRGLQHLVYTRGHDGRACLYLDGYLASESTTPGSMANWDSSYPLLVAGELGTQRPWLGEIFLMAIYDRVLSKEDIARNQAAGSGADGRAHLALGSTPVLRPWTAQGSGIVVSPAHWVVRNLGAELLFWKAQEDADWLDITPPSSVLLAGQQ
ncbi:MAG: LamG domain-containing protein, partial [Planctomycetes bacterium]|nr:LamG domain-containing protein [Planctomycetota bacterium]